MALLILVPLGIWTLCSLLLTLNTLSPLMNRATAKPVSLVLGFGLGWLVGELVPHWILLHAGFLFLVWASGWVDPNLLFLFFLVHLAGWMLLILRLWLILDLPERLEQQLQAQLGQPYAETKPNRKAPQHFSEVDWISWLLPSSIYRDRRIQVEFGREYEAAPGLKMRLDIYRQREPDNRRPALVQIHGGGWILGTLRQGAPLMVKMASQGWVCFSISYRLSPGVCMPEHLIDCKRALHWIRRNSSKFGIDPQAIFMTGGSAGAHLALMMALTPNRPEFQPGFEEAETSVQGCVGLYGVFDLHSAFDNQHPQKARAKLLEVVLGGTPQTKPERYRQASPFHWHAKALPPCMLVQGGSDTLVPLSEAKRMHCRNSTESTQSQTLLCIPLAEHAFDIFPSLMAQCVLPFVERFLILQHQTLLQQKESDGYEHPDYIQNFTGN